MGAREVTWRIPCVASQRRCEEVVRDVHLLGAEPLASACCAQIPVHGKVAKTRSATSGNQSTQDLGLKMGRRHREKEWK